MKTFLKILILGCCIFIFHQTTSAQIGRLALSPLQKVELKIAKTTIKISYCRPSKRDRVIFGGLVPYDQYWRTGANRNTKISFSEEASLDGNLIPAGEYAIFTKPSENTWQFILYSDTQNWDVPEEIDSKKIVAQIEVSSHQTGQLREALNISIDSFDNYSFTLKIEWEKTAIFIPFGLQTKELMNATIEDVLAGPNADDYYLAAVYQMESEKDWQKGLDYINQGIKIREEPVWWEYRVQAILLIELKKKTEAKKAIERILELAKKSESEYGLEEFERLHDLLRDIE